MSRASILAFAVLTIGIGACASTPSFRSTWKNPDAAPVSLSGQKVLAVVQVRDEAQRRSGEDLLAAEITKRGGQGIASYTLFPSSAREQNEEMARAAAQRAGISGLVLVNMLGSETTVTRESNYDARWRNDLYFRRPWGAWGRGWNTMYEPTATVRRDVAVIVETRVYSLEQDKLLWAGTSETMNPDGTGEFMRTLAAGVAAQLEQAGVLRR